ncbi:unnamed protein product [Brassicogethes aeneus]|uniref:Tantalus-like domain-containing protein n=1 Tax=Brassicogethes aeneus TaxID=1431903 RepID=A0A9P0AVD1_BRAAE|nr:unnamed protein product [Brassicogethes aeneus]
MEGEMDTALASLDLNDGMQKKRLSEEVEEKTSPRRSSRKKIKECDNRRVIIKPKKIDRQKEIKNYYLDKRVKKGSPCLETIFEEPQLVKGKSITISHKKLKRLLNFNTTNLMTKQKTKKRQMKSKKEGIFKPRKKISMDILMDKLSCIKEED